MLGRMKTASGITATILMATSWIAAIAVGLYIEYIGWRTVISDDKVGEGLAIAVLAAPAAFMLTQTVFGLLAAPLAMYSDREQT